MKIRFLPTFPISIAYGGQEIVQEVLINTLRAQQPDWDIGLVDFTLRESVADIYHLVGNSASLAYVVRYIPEHIPIVLSVIDGMRDDSLIKRKLKQTARAFAKLAREETTYGQLSYLFRRASKVLPLNSHAAAFTQSRYGVPSERIAILPNGASPTFFERPEVETLGILIAGSLIHRKRTHEAIDFAESSYGRRHTFHFVGGLQNNELAYGNECIARIAAASNCIYHGFIPQQSIDFWKVFDSCRYFLQLSDEETQSLSALEAIAGGKRCVFRRAAYSAVAPFDRFPSVAVATPAAISAALLIAESQNVDRSLVSSWTQISKNLANIYRGVVA